VRRSKKDLIVWILWGLKSAEASSNAHHLRLHEDKMGYQFCKADAYLWTKAVVRADDGTKYYAYLLL